MFYHPMNLHYSQTGRMMILLQKKKNQRDDPKSPHKRFLMGVVTSDSSEMIVADLLKDVKDNEGSFTIL